ncbi:LysM peptidoglycan-binding domain-containing protein [Dactylosporangium maewongense]|uniref:LysM peptidoglycan-binding domain-containing protein n=1 Tax=Dactylosporangium maewongense TaxID=634393 RepID=A0ABP4LHC8_9ACTN
MERVAFVVDETGERIDCLLNPETFEVKRLAGIRTPAAGESRLVGRGRADDPVRFTGGGRTELLLDMVFDVALVESRSAPQDVRQLTAKLWNLAENTAEELGSARPPLVRLVWGRSWNVPGVIAAIAERFDAFGPTGAPGRSWMRLKLVRVDEPKQAGARDFDGELARSGAGTAPGTAPTAVQALGDGSTGPGGTGRIDLLAMEALGSPMRWRELAEHNGVDDPFAVAPGRVLSVPATGGRP